MNKFYCLTVFFLIKIIFFTPATSICAEKIYTAINDYNYPPYSFINDNGNPDGFSIDILRAICREMKIKCKIELKSWHECFSDLESGKAEIVTGMFYSPERNKTYDFSIPHITVFHSIFVRKDGISINSIDDIKGKKILCERFDIIHEYLSKKIKKENIIPVDTQEHAILLLASGQYDLAITGEFLGHYFIKKRKIQNLTTTGVSIVPGNFCMAVKKGNKVLLEIMNRGLIKIKKTGEYDKIFSHWFLPAKHEKTKTKYFLMALASLVLLILLISSWTFALNRKVNRKTIEIQQELKSKKIILDGLEQGYIFLSTLLNTIPAPVFYKELNGKYIGCNSSYAEFLGIKKGDIINKTLHNFVTPDIAELHIQKEKILIEKEKPLVYESIMVDRHENTHNVLLYKDLYPDSTGKKCGIIGVLINITETKNIQEKLEDSLQEKEILLKEVHHRVKNNLQIISSLLNLQSMKMEDENTIKQFQASRNRICSMALIHEKLYQTGNFSQIDMIDYIKDLIIHLSQLYSTNQGRITYDIKNTDIKLSINQAIPCGLVINEIISNSLKHAFPETFKEMGVIKIRLKKSENRIEFMISDNGIGFPEHFDTKNLKSLGFQLINNIITHQLSGKLKTESQYGNTMHLFNFEIE